MLSFVDLRQKSRTSDRRRLLKVKAQTRTHWRGAIRRALQGWALERLESRIVPSTFVVSRADDGLDFLGHPLPGTLRYEIDQANQSPELDSIVFNFSQKTTIDLDKNALFIDAPVILDGTTVGGYTGDPLVQLAFHVPSRSAVVGVSENAKGSMIRGLSIDSTEAVDAGILVQGANVTISQCAISDTRAAIEVDYGASGATIKGCRMVGNSVGVTVDGDGAVIGGTNSGDGNYIANNRIGIGIVGGGSHSVIQGNDIETNSADGILVYGSDNQIGGADPTAGNRITGNGNGDPNLGDFDGSGINLGLSAAGNVIQGNSISANGRSDDATTGGVRILSSGNLIGGNAPGQGNQIFGNAGQGIVVGDLLLGSSISVSNNRIQGNLIGLEAPGQASGNNFDGIDLEGGARNNLIGGTDAGTANVIAYNGRGGVENERSEPGNSILGNSIFNNQNGSIGNQSTVRSLELTGVQPTGSAVVIKGVLSGLSQADYRVELFATPGGSLFPEGRTYLGFVTIFTTGVGNAEFTATDALPSGAGDWITATATGPDGGTSGFSQGFRIRRQPNLAATLPTWNATDGGVDFGYTISDADLPHPPVIDLYWASGTTSDTTIGNPIVTPTATKKAQGASESFHVSLGQLGTPRQGAKYLLAVVNPPGANHIPESDETNGKDPNDTACLQLSDIQMLTSTATDSQDVSFIYQVIGPNLAGFQVGVYRSAHMHFDPSVDIQVGNLVTIAAADATAGEHHGAWHGSLPIDPAHPYVLVVANPLHTVPESDAGDYDENNVASFRKWVIGVVTNGLLPAGDLQAGWVTTMANSLKDLISPEGTVVGYDDVIPFIWGNTSNLPIPGQAVAAGLDLARKVRDNAQSLAIQMGPNDIIDLHLIGHSRGAVVISQALMDLQNDPGISQLQAGYKKMTMLDPHPANSLGSGLFSINLASRVSLAAQAINLAFCRVANDPNVVVPGNVDMAEDYYQHTAWNQTTDLIGRYLINLWGVAHIPGALDNDLTHAAPWMAHTRVTDWYQQYVIPSLASPSYWQLSGGGAAPMIAPTTLGEGGRIITKDMLIALPPDMFQPIYSLPTGMTTTRKRSEARL
jgi:hypothetical protein